MIKIELDIDPNKSPELVAWARSKALEFVEIDTDKLKLASIILDEDKSDNRLITRYLTDSEVGIIISLNPIKLKTK